MQNRINNLAITLSKAQLSDLNQQDRDELNRLSDWFGTKYSNTAYLPASNKIIIERIGVLSSIIDQQISILNNQQLWPYYALPKHWYWRNEGEKRWNQRESAFGLTFYATGNVHFSKKGDGTSFIVASRPFVAFMPNYFLTPKRAISTVIHETMHVILGQNHPAGKYALGKIVLKFSQTTNPFPVETAMLKPESWGSYVMQENSS